MVMKQDGSDMTMTGVISKINQPVTIVIPADAQKLPG